MRRQQAILWAGAAGLVVSLQGATAQAHSRRISHGPTRATFVGIAPPDGVSPRLIVRHRTETGAAIEDDPVTLTDPRTGTRFAEHAHGEPLLQSGLSLRTELVIDAPAVCPSSDLAAARYRLRDLANALRHTFTPGERYAITLLEAGRPTARLAPTDRPAEALAWLTAQCGARPAAAAPSPFDAPKMAEFMETLQPAAAPDETVVWLLFTAGAEARLSAADGALLAGVGVALLESFTPAQPAATLTPATERQSGAYQTDPIVAQLKSTGMRTEPEADTAWSPFCAALTGVGGSCLLGGVVSGATAMVSQRLIAEGQALFVTPASCLPEGLGQLELATETGKVVVPAARLTAAQCDRWQAPVQPAAPKPSTGWIAAVGALLFAVAATLLLRRRQRATASGELG
jgi:hypothetical protein